MVKQTRKNRQRGGFFSEEDKHRIQGTVWSLADTAQSIHYLSQLKRFAPCIQSTPLRAYQFFYNLGRLQELLGETTHPEIWWKPIEKLVTNKKYSEIESHIDILQGLTGLEYDMPTITKGC